MALTPDDVLNKRFQTTKFRDGYEQDEVDDFLDEVVVEFRNLLSENEELKTKLAKAEADLAEAKKQGSSVAAAPVAPTAPAAAPAPAAAAATEAKSETDESTELLKLARRLHDEHVQAGKDEEQKLIASARNESRRILEETQQRKTKELNDLTERKTALEATIKDLESFERQYRGSLKSFITTQLRDLESTGSLDAVAKAQQTKN
ncbi:DivIVA domain-containing protein [Pseudoclavibacter soli]|uniref:DivIVA domain-containing protein n=1 Tax=Pseudoclavibacter soli TaxID=452623 RepID=UPI0003F4C0A0|nr:DivIVA domain-containing protein [Pseudoclavibacter soli]